MLHGIVEFACGVAVVALASAFLLSLMVKWGWLEWLQVHAPNEFIGKLLNCKFCCSWWVGLVASLIVCIVTGMWVLMLAPICSTVITRDLW